MGSLELFNQELMNRMFSYVQLLCTPLLPLPPDSYQLILLCEQVVVPTVFLSMEWLTLINAKMLCWQLQTKWEVEVGMMLEYLQLQTLHLVSSQNLLVVVNFEILQEVGHIVDRCLEHQRYGNSTINVRVENFGTIEIMGN